MNPGPVNPAAAARHRLLGDQAAGRVGPGPARKDGDGREAWISLGRVPARPGLQMALDEILLMEVAAGRRPATLRFWTWTRPALVLGANQSVRNEVDLELAAELGFELTRRMSGGGTMVCEPGRTITWSLVLPEAWVRPLSFRDSYRALDSWAVGALAGMGAEVEYRGINEIGCPGGKVAGAAQARRRGAVLHHVTMAYSTEPDLVPRLIRIGRGSVSARGTRSAERPVCPLARLVPHSIGEAVGSLEAAFGAEHAVEPGRLGPADLEAAETLAAAKYETPAWIHRLP